MGDARSFGTQAQGLAGKPASGMGIACAGIDLALQIMAWESGGRDSIELAPETP
jgi:hypothetical protein